jgi:hypothetical protein
VGLALLSHRLADRADGTTAAISVELLLVGFVVAAVFGTGSVFFDVD